MDVSSDLREKASLRPAKSSMEELDLRVGPSDSEPLTKQAVGSRVLSISTAHL